MGNDLETIANGAKSGAIRSLVLAGYLALAAGCGGGKSPSPIGPSDPSPGNPNPGTSGVTVKGRIINPETDKGYSGTVRLEGNGGTYSGSLSNGNWEVANVPSGDYKATATGDLLSTSFRVMVNQGGTNQIPTWYALDPLMDSTLLDRLARRNNDATIKDGNVRWKLNDLGELDKVQVYIDVPSIEAMSKTSGAAPFDYIMDAIENHALGNWIHSCSNGLFTGKMDIIKSQRSSDVPPSGTKGTIVYKGVILNNSDKYGAIHIERLEGNDIVGGAVHITQYGDRSGIIEDTCQMVSGLRTDVDEANPNTRFSNRATVELPTAEDLKMAAYNNSRRKDGNRWRYDVRPTGIRSPDDASGLVTLLGIMSGSTAPSFNLSLSNMDQFGFKDPQVEVLRAKQYEANRANGPSRTKYRS